MALVLKDRVKEQTTTTGTGSVTLGGAVSGFEAFSAVGDGNTTYYVIAHQTADEWEVGLGTYTATGTLLSRDTILESSNSDLAVNFSAGTKDVFVTYPADKSVYKDGSDNVGIGTLSPSQLLQVTGVGSTTGSSDPSILLSSTGTGASDDTIFRMQIGGTSASNYIYFGDSTDNDVGRIRYSHSSNFMAFNVNAAEALRINSSGNVGIKTSAPGGDLHVQGDAGNQVRLYLTDGDATGTGNSLLISKSGTTSYVSDRQAGSSLWFGTADTERMRIDSSGNVGIGTSSPDRDLHVNNSTGDVLLSLTSSDSGIAGLDFGDQSDVNAGFIQYDNSDNSMRFRTGGSGEDVRIDSSGNVGIGTTSPQTLLHVQSSSDGEIARFQRTGGLNLPILQIQASETNNTVALAATGAATPDLFFTTGGSERMRIDSSGSVGIGVSTIDTALSTKLHVAGTIRTDTGAAAANPAIVFDHDNFADADANYIMLDRTSEAMRFTVNASERLRIDSSGNVGIGTSSPSKPLHIYSATDEIFRLETPDNQVGNIFQSFNDASGNLALFGMFDSSRILRLNNVQSDGEIAFLTNNSEAVRIDSSGNVGIGTASPDTLFTVNGQAAIGDLVAGSANLTNFLSGTPPQLIAGWSIPAVTWTPAAWVEAVFTRDGDMGIDILASNTGSSMINFSDTDDENVGIIEYDHASDYMRFHVNASERMRIDSSGNVGVGTSSPVSDLHLGSSNSAPATSGSMADNGLTISNGAGGRAIQIGVDDASARSYIQAGYVNNANVATHLSFLNGANESIRITSGGNVGVGTTSPAKQLEITKSARATITSLTDAVSITSDFDAAQNFAVTLAGNRTLANPSNIDPGQTGSIFVVQDATGGRTLSFGSVWKFAGGTAPTMSTGAAAVDRIDYVVQTSTAIHAVASLNLS